MSIKKPYLKTFSNVKIFGSAYRSDKINHGWVKQIFSNLPNDIISEILYVTFNVKASRILSANIVCGNGVNVKTDYIVLSKKHRISKANVKDIQNRIRQHSAQKFTGIMNPRSWALEDIPHHNGLYLNTSLHRATMFRHLTRMDHNEVLSRDVWCNVFHLDEDWMSRNYNYENEMMASGFRTLYNKRFSWSIITKELVDTIAKHYHDKKVIDVGCGSGYLAQLLKNRGVDITAVDCRDAGYTFVAPELMDVKVHDYRDIDYSKYDVVILSWPNYESEHASELLDKLTDKHTLLYCGEGMGGCTADTGFFNKLAAQFKYVDEDTKELRKAALSFSHIRDDWTVYQRVRDTNVVRRKGKHYQITGEKNNLVFVQRLDDDFNPIPHGTGSYDKAEFFKPESWFDW